MKFLPLSMQGVDVVGPEFVTGLSAPPPPDGRWWEAGLCHQTDPEAFFPEVGQSPRKGKAICARCPSMAECHQYALDNKIAEGTWGGVSASERQRMWRSAGRAA